MILINCIWFIVGMNEWMKEWMKEWVNGCMNELSGFGRIVFFSFCFVYFLPSLSEIVLLAWISLRLELFRCQWCGLTLSLALSIKNSTKTQWLRSICCHYWIKQYYLLDYYLSWTFLHVRKVKLWQWRICWSIRCQGHTPTLFQARELLPLMWRMLCKSCLYFVQMICCELDYSSKLERPLDTR